MRYWDACAVVPLVYQEATSATLRALFQDEHDNFSLETVRVEGECTFARLLHEGRISASQAARMRRETKMILDTFSHIKVGSGVIEAAIQLARAHPIELRAGDALHLAAWQVVCAGDLSAVEFVTLDKRLKNAALAEGSTVLP